MQGWKNCPFCGREITDKNVMQEDYFDSLWGDDYGMVNIRCGNCDLVMYEHDQAKYDDFPKASYKELRERLRERWNTRRRGTGNG